MAISRLSGSLAALAALVLFSAAAAAPASAQGNPGLTVLAGPSPYDLSGTGTDAVYGVAADASLGGLLVVEPGLRFFRYDPQGAAPAGGQHIGLLLPELSVQLQLPLPVVRPYVGAGAGSSVVVEGTGRDELTLHGAVGARIHMGGGWSLRPEFRLRSVDPFTGSTGDATVGIRYGF